MTREAFSEMVARLEGLAAENPRGYTRRVMLLAALGYLYIFGSVIFLILLTVGLAWSLLQMGSAAAWKILLPPLVALGAILSALAVRIPPPRGLPLPESQVPRLHDLIRDVSLKLAAPMPHTVLAVPQVNAAIVQIPRMGLFGWYRNYLLVGTPLLQALAPDEWRAVLAHEMGHLSGNHGRFSTWIYRQRTTWVRLQESLLESGNAFGKFLFGRFLAWYGPYFQAYTFVLARQNEYDADASAASSAGHDAFRRALLRIEIVARFAEHGFWDKLNRSVMEVDVPPDDAFTKLAGALGDGPEPDAAEEWLAEAWRGATDVEDTHPSLASRMRSLGWEGEEAGEEPPPAPRALTGPSAAQEYLGEMEGVLNQAFDQDWFSAVSHQWGLEHQRLRAAADRLDVLSERVPEETSVEEQWEQIQLTAELASPEEAAPLARRLLERVPEHPGALFFLGQLLLRDGNPDGPRYMERAMHLDPEAVLLGSQILYGHYLTMGDREEAERWRARGEGHMAELAAADQERSRLPRDMELAPADLAGHAVEAIRVHLAGVRDVGKAYLCRRSVELFPHRPSYLLAVLPGIPWWKPVSQKRYDRILQAVSDLGGAAIEADLRIALIRAENGWMKSRMEEIEGARIFP